MATPGHLSGRWIGLGWKLAVLVLLLIAAKYVGDWVDDRVLSALTPSTQTDFHRFIMASMAAFVLLMALPFVPGAEIGLSLMMMFGPQIAPMVYGGTVLALTLSYLVGWLVPTRAIVGLFRAIRLRRAAELLETVESLEPAQRLEFLMQTSSSRAVPFLLRYRYLAIILALNLPGNMVIGGGGGICLVAGFSRLFSFPKFLFSLAVAVAPVPLLMVLGGYWTG